MLDLLRAGGGRTESIRSSANRCPPRRAITPAAAAVLAACARPYKDGASILQNTATNEHIAEELSFDLDAVKTHLRTLFRKPGIEHLPQHQKRAAAGSDGAAVRPGLDTELCGVGGRAADPRLHGSRSTAVTSPAPADARVPLPAAACPAGRVGGHRAWVASARRPGG